MINATLSSGSNHSISVSEDAGVVSLVASMHVDIGGGAAAGALKATSSNSVQLSVEQLALLGLEALKGKLPSMSAEIGVVEEALKLELAKA